MRRPRAAIDRGPTGGWDDVGHLDRWSHLFVIGRDRRRGAAAGHAPATGASADIAWIPDGRTVAFTSDRGPEPDLQPAAHDLGRRRRRERRRRSQPREVLAPGRLGHRSPAYSPDGRWLAADRHPRGRRRSTT